MSRTTKEDRQRFAVGDWVTASGFVTAVYPWRGVGPKRLLFSPAPFVGQVAGARRVEEGFRDYNGEYHYWVASEVYTVWEVRRAVYGVPLLCLTVHLNHLDPRQRPEDGLPWIANPYYPPALNPQEWGDPKSFLPCEKDRGEGGPAVEDPDRAWRTLADFPQDVVEYRVYGAVYRFPKGGA